MDSPKRKLRLLLWRARIRCMRLTSRSIYCDVNQTYWIDPSRIRLSLDHPELDRLSPEAPIPQSPISQRGEVHGGDWDLKAIPFEIMDVWRAFEHRFINHGRWEETDFYNRISRTIKGGVRVFGCNSLDTFHSRLNRIDQLFEEIKRDGYKAQPQLNKTNPVWFADEDEIQLHIGRHGDYIFADGRHRLCIAKILELQKVAVKVARRHANWVNLRREILAYKSRNNGRLYAPISHPDLADLTCAHGNERMEILKRGLEQAFGREPPYQGKLLDIGAHWGYFAQQCEHLGFNAEAVEVSPINQYFLEKLKRAENCRFKLISDSVLNLNGDVKYDVVLALNIFHHFLKTKEDYEAFCSFLGRLRARFLFFEPHKPDEPQMRDAFKNYLPMEFAEFIRRSCHLSQLTQIGTADDGRSLFLLS
jgi:hypothetical protein